MEGIAVWIAGTALVAASASLGVSVWTATRLRRPLAASDEEPVDDAPDPAAALTDAALVWQQLAIDCEALQNDALHSVVGDPVKKAVAERSAEALEDAALSFRAARELLIDQK